MMITCGNCKGKHDGKEAVKECHKNGRPGTPAESSTPAFVSDPATKKQLDFIAKLRTERNTAALGSHVTIDVVEVDMHSLEGKPLSKAEASKLINGLLQCPPKPNSNWDDIPVGKYALPGNGGVVQFYEVYRPNKGKWEGFTFLSFLTGSVGDWSRSRVKPSLHDTILRRIKEDPIKWARLFGDKTKTCGRCSSPLSNIQSRAAGFGHTCARKVGWPYPTKAEAIIMLNERGIDPLSKDEVEEVKAKASRDECEGDECVDILNMCSKHSAQYQAMYGRAANE